MKFEWDEAKAKGNFAKHGISFDEAASVFLSSSTQNEYSARVSFRLEGPLNMSEIITIVKMLPDGRLTRARRSHKEAKASGFAEEAQPYGVDSDNKPLTPAQLKSMKRVPRVKTLRRALQLTQEEFAMRYQIPIGTLRDWEQGRSEPDAPARAYLKVIAADPGGTATTLAKSKVLRSSLRS